MCASVRARMCLLIVTSMLVVADIGDCSSQRNSFPNPNLGPSVYI